VFRSARYQGGFSIDAVASCDFERLVPVTNAEVLERGGRKADPRLLGFLCQEVGIEGRFFCPPERNAFDLAKEAIERLLAQDPSLRTEAEFLIYCGISNPMPTVCHAALLAHELEFTSASCWDLKSGCSTAVLGLVQALEWFERGARRGVLVASETFSKFTNPEALELAATSGDGACAIALSATDAWRARGVVHGTNPTYFKSAYVPGKYPVDVERWRQSDYWFSFDAKPQAITAIGEAWVKSLADVLQVSELPGERVTHYVSHQIDAKKNRQFAKSGQVPDAAIYENFRRFGNMGCPTVLLNYQSRPLPTYAKGDVLLFHAVGGGISHAALCLERMR